MSSSERISARTTRFLEAALATDMNSVQTSLSTKQVIIHLDPTVAHTFAGQMVLFTLLNLLVRLDIYAPQLLVVLPPVPRHALVRVLDAGMLTTALEAFFSPFSAADRLSFTDRAPQGVVATAQIVISPRPKAGWESLWADGWIIYLNQVAPFHPDVANSVGACVAADFMAAEVFKKLIAGLPLKPGLKVLPLDSLIFSAYDYQLQPGPNPALPETVNVDSVVVVGLGGIGAGFVSAASALPRLAGKLTLVDKDQLDSTNLNRLLYARPGNTGNKVDLCQRALEFHRSVDPRVAWYDEFIAQEGSQQDLVVVGVDDDAVRRSIQGSLPRLILNAGTSDSGSFQLTRHDYLHGACLACVATADHSTYTEERELARLLGLTLETVLHYRASGAPVPRAVLQVSNVLTEGDIERLSERPIREIQQRVCAHLPIGTGAQEEAVSISFLSALPGFLLLGEVIKERSTPRDAQPPLNWAHNHLLLSLLGRPRHSHLRSWRGKSPRCDCVRTVWQHAYARKWGTHSNDA